jgi:hypothetical protein
MTCEFVAVTSDGATEYAGSAVNWFSARGGIDVMINDQHAYCHYHVLSGIPMLN